METMTHPGRFISSQVTDIIRNFAAEAEKLGELHPMQLEKIYENNWLKSFCAEGKWWIRNEHA